jgi:hypothetical protein
MHEVRRLLRKTVLYWTYYGLIGRIVKVLGAILPRCWAETEMGTRCGRPCFIGSGGLPIMSILGGFGLPAIILCFLLASFFYSFIGVHDLQGLA